MVLGVGFLIVVVVVVVAYVCVCCCCCMHVFFGGVVVVACMCFIFGFVCVWCEFLCFLSSIIT